MKVLGIETSCDDTGVAIYDENHGILSNEIYNQKLIHSQYGGIIPELASREHLSRVIPLVRTVFKKSNIQFNQINAIAYTAGPGMIGPLLIGYNISQALAFSWKIPAIPINHMEAHLLSTMMESNVVQFPFIGLLISGAHTQLINAIKISKYYLLGESVDDAVGEAFDKIAKLLGIDYPGGAGLSEMAKTGNPNRFNFPRPMINSPNLNFSFSGLKTFASNVIRNNDHDPKTLSDIARAFEDAVIDTLSIKCQRALDLSGYTRLVIAGGVSANFTLRKRMTKMMELRGGELFYTKQPKLCTDNGAMIAYTGFIHYKLGIYNKYNVNVRSKWPLTEM